MDNIPEEPTPEQIRALVEACPQMVKLTYPGPWGSTIHTWIPLGRHRPEPDWGALVPDLPHEYREDDEMPFEDPWVCSACGEKTCPENLSLVRRSQWGDPNAELWIPNFPDEIAPTEGI